MIDENAERHDPGTHSPPRGGEFRLGRARARLGIAISGAVRFLGTVRPYRRPSSRSAKTMGGGDARNDSLAHWVSTQRNYYARHQNGQHTSLTEERIRMLDSIGFAWKVLR